MQPWRRHVITAPQLGRGAEKGEQDEEYPPSNGASLAVAIDDLIEGV